MVILFNLKSCRVCMSFFPFLGDSKQSADNRFKVVPGALRQAEASAAQ